MDILITYWNSVWQTAVHAANTAHHGPTADEWAAYHRSLKRDMPSAGGTGGAASPDGNVIQFDRRRVAAR